MGRRRQTEFALDVVTYRNDRIPKLIQADSYIGAVAKARSEVMAEGINVLYVEPSSGSSELATAQEN